jgi:hypothetical protein
MTDRDDREDRDVRDAPSEPVVGPPPPPPAPPVKRRGFARRHWKGLTLATVVLLPLAAVALWVTTTLAYSYSSGWRAGFNQKISRKGWVCKTWEGELAISSVPGVAPTIWSYSVRSDSVARAIEALAGQQVEIHYAQHKGVPTKCFGETEYYADGVRKVGS